MNASQGNPGLYSPGMIGMAKLSLDNWLRLHSGRVSQFCLFSHRTNNAGKTVNYM